MPRNAWWAPTNTLGASTVDSLPETRRLFGEVANRETISNFALSGFALTLAWTGGAYEEAIFHPERAVRLSQRDPAKICRTLPRVLATLV